MPSTPCNNCPWRKDAEPAYWHPDHFTSIWDSCQDDGVGQMLCHKATKLPPEQQSKLLCRGWLIVLGTDAIGVRLALMRKTITSADLDPASGCPPLYETFADMVRAQGIDPPPWNRITDRRGR